MTPQELKASILQLAIQGKLVEQRLEEGTGAELLEKILAAKNAKSAKNNLTRRRGERGVPSSHVSHLESSHAVEKIYAHATLPSKNISANSASPREEIPDSEKPFDIPESWEWVRLGELLKVIGGVSYDKKDVCNSGLRILRGGNIQNMEIVLDDADVFLPEQYRDVEKIVRVGDILIVASTGSKTVIGKAGYVDKPIPQTMIGAFLRICRPSSLEFVGYLRIIFDSDFYRKHIRELSQGTNINNIKEAYITQFAIPLPPLAEQKRIVAKIEKLLPYIDRYEKAWSKLEEFNKRFPGDMQKSLLQMAIQGKLVEQCPEEGTGEELYRQIQSEKQRLIKAGKLRKTKPLPGITKEDLPVDFPDSWKICYVDDIAFVTKLAGFEYTNVVSPNLTANGIPLFKGKNIQNGELVLKFESYIPETVSDELPRSQIRKKCLLTPYVGTIGNIAIFDGSFKAHLGSNVGKIELFNGVQESVVDEYVLHYLRSPLGYNELTKFKKATAQESISIDAIRNVIIPLPPLAEQKRIVAKLEELLPLCERLK